VNVVLAFAILFVLALGANRVNQTVGDIQPGTPAAAKLKPGDKIVAVDGNRYLNLSREERLERFVEQVGTHKCLGKPEDGCRAATPVELTVWRGGGVQTISVRPKYDAEIERTRIGFGYGSEPAHLGAAGAAGRAADLMWLVSSRTITVFARLFEEEKRKEVSGVVGVSSVANETIDLGLEKSLLLLALVSLSLGLINLFPFLPLDGGHIFWSLVEKARRKPVPFAVMERASVVGFVLVAMLFFIGLTNDIGRLTGEGFNVR
jgi:regulator of sigma E protease